MPGYTSHYSFPYPLPGDPIYLGAAQMQALATNVDAALYAAGTPELAQTNPPRVTAKRTTNLGIASNTDTIITFNGVDYDSEAVRVPAFPMYSSSTTLTVRVSGIYMVNLAVIMVGAGGTRNARVLLNGTTSAATLLTRAEAGTVDTIAMSGQFKFAAGDVLRAMTWQNSGGTVNIVSATATMYTRFSLVWVGPTSA